MKKQFLLFCLSLFIFAGCSHKTAEQDNALPDSTYELKYAHGFTIDQFPEYQRIRVYNPWKKEEVLATYYLIKDSSIVTPTSGTRLLIPIKSLAISSCTHIGFLDIIDELQSVTGVCNPELIYNETIRTRCENKQIISLGDAFNINTERLLLLKPEGIMFSSYNQKDDNANRLESAGIPIIYNHEWTESSILGRTEWIKFVAAFFDELPLADSLFAEVEQSYLSISKQTKALDHKPTILAGGNFKGTWYMPSGRCYMGQLFADAGTSYVYENDTTDGSLPLNFETVLHLFSDADVWLNAPVNTMEQLYDLDSRHKLFKAAKNKRVYSFNKRIKPAGANDFWESAVAHPDLVLKDIILTIHPELVPNYESTYLIHLQ